VYSCESIYKHWCKHESFEEHCKWRQCIHNYNFEIVCIRV